MKRVNRRKMQDTSTQSVWRSYADMMSGLLLLFVLIMAVCLMQAQKNYDEKLKEQAKQMQTQSQLDESLAQLNASLAQVDEQSQQLASQQLTMEEQEALLAQQSKTLKELQATLAQKEEELSKKESTLKTTQIQLDEQSKLLADRDAALASSQAQLDEQTALMAQQQAKIDQIIGVKADLIASLNDEFQAKQISVEIDYETGAMVLDSSVLFDYNQSELTAAGTQILAQVLPVYCKVLLSEEYESYLAEIIIDGYTDTTGDYITNLDLSQKRAFAVAEYLVNVKDSFLNTQESEMLLERLTANGRSMSNPIRDAYGNVDMDASRRVEIKFRLKDEEMLAEMQAVIEETGIAKAFLPQMEAEPQENPGQITIYE